jgi:hypothetical protein
VTSVGGPFDDMDDTFGFLHLRDPLQLDDGTVDRLLDGMPADDAPPSYRGVVELLSTLTSAPSEIELAGERHAVATMTALHAEAVWSPRRRSTAKRRLRRSGAALVGTATLFVGLGAAGALPGAAQSVASDVLATVGVDAPSPNVHADDHPDMRGRSDDVSGTAGTADTGSARGNPGTGDTVSGIAADGSTTGVDKGAAVSSDASDGASQAGEHGGGAPDVIPPEASPPVSTPVTGGPPATLPPNAENGEQGRTIGDEKSDGRADTGLDKAVEPPTAPAS